MNYEQMNSRLAAGLAIIESVQGDIDVGCHTYMVIVPNCTYSLFSGDQLAELTNDLGWSWSKDLGWVFPTIG